MDGLYEKAMLTALGALLQSRPDMPTIVLVDRAFEIAEQVMVTRARRSAEDGYTELIRGALPEYCVGGFRNHSWGPDFRCIRCKGYATQKIVNRLKMIQRRRIRKANAVAI